MKDKKIEYVKPEIEIVFVETTDVITMSEATIDAGEWE